MGIDIERFLDVNPELVCSICHQVFENPVETPCRHTFCSSCIYNWVNRSITRENNCPACRTRVDHHSIQPALPIIKNILSKQKMYCDCFEQGCKEVVIMDKMKLHLEVCPYQVVPCCHDECMAFVMRKSLKKHEQSCVKRKIVCPNGCGNLVVFQHARNHGCDANVMNVDDKITCREEKRNSLERLDSAERQYKNWTPTHLTGQISKTSEDIDQMNTAANMKEVNRKPRDSRTSSRHVGKARRGKSRKVVSEKMTKRKPKRLHKGKTNFTTRKGCKS